MTASLWFPGIPVRRGGRLRRGENKRRKKKELLVYILINAAGRRLTVVCIEVLINRDVMAAIHY